MPTAAIVGGSLLGTAVAASGARSAARSQERAAQAGVDEQKRQFDIAQENFQPFLEAGQGALTEFQTGLAQAPDAPQLQPFGGQAIQAPTLQRFQGQAPQLQQSLQDSQLQRDIRQTDLTGFQSGAQEVGQFTAQAPQLEQFRFDPRQALNDPALQFQQEMGQQALSRQIGKNRMLGSGQRLIEAQKFGQGLASQSLGDEFQRQLAGTQQRNLATGQQFGQEAQRAQLRAGITGQQFGQDVRGNQLANQLAQQQFGQGLQAGQFANQAAQQQFQQGLAGAQFGNQAQQQAFQNQLGLNQLANQQAVQQQGLQRQQLSDEKTLAAQEQNRLLTQFGLTNQAFNDRLNRLAGLVDVGRGTAGSLAQAGQTAGTNTANLLAAQGQAQAAGQLGRANIIGSGLQQITGGLAFGGALSPQLTTAQQFGTVPGSQQTNMLAQQNAGF